MSPPTYSVLPRRRSGFTMIELMIVIVIAGTLVMMGIGGISTFMTQSKVSRAAQSITNDLQSAFLIAARNRQPVRVAWDSNTVSFAVTNRTQTQTFRRVGIGATSGYNLRASDVQVYPGKGFIEVFPNGLATDSFTVRISKNGYSKRVRMTRAGLVLSR